MEARRARGSAVAPPAQLLLGWDHGEGNQDKSLSYQKQMVHLFSIGTCPV